MQPRILLADDHTVARKGISFLCQFDLGFTEVAEVCSCSGLMKELANKDYTHLVLDINLADDISLRVLPEIRSLYPCLRIAMLTMRSAAIYAKQLRRQYGIAYYISKAVSEEDSMRLVSQFLQDMEPDQDSFDVQEPYNPFSDLGLKQLEILHFILQGLGTKEIARMLNLGQTTISSTKTRIFEKTGASNLKELMALATLYKFNI